MDPSLHQLHDLAERRLRRDGRYLGGHDLRDGHHSRKIADAVRLVEEDVSVLGGDEPAPDEASQLREQACHPIGRVDPLDDHREMGTHVRQQVRVQVTRRADARRSAEHRRSRRPLPAQPVQQCVRGRLVTDDVAFLQVDADAFRLADRLHGASALTNAPLPLL